MTSPSLPTSPESHVEQPGADFVVIVAVQDAGLAKSRLGPDLEPHTRRNLVIAMLDDMLATVREVWQGRVVVVSADAVYDPIARDHGAEVIRDRGTGYNEAVILALSHVADAEAALVMPGDLPHIDVNDVATLLNGLIPEGVLVVPAEDGGTLALGLHPPDVIVPRFGPDSAAAHAEAAREAGVAFGLVHPGELRHDVDTLADLARVWDQVGEATTALLEHLPLPTLPSRVETSRPGREGETTHD